MITQLIKFFIRNPEKSFVLSAKLDERANDLVKALTEQTQKIKNLAASIITVLSTYLTTAKNPKETKKIEKVELQKDFSNNSDFQDVEL